MKLASPKPEIHLSIDAARAVMIHAQELEGAPTSQLIPVLERTGFVRTLGGVDVYLAVRARVPELERSLGRFLVEDLGHGRSFSLDTDENLRTRAAYVRRLSG